MSSNTKFKYILLTGPPGIGKTTLVKKVCEILKGKNFKLNGFYTEEIRENKERIGFDIVTLDGKRSPLARCNSPSLKGPNVGKYTVDIKSFESCCLPVFNSEKSAILVIDEIGKMELFSDEFKRNVQKCFSSSHNVILATVPIPKGKPIPLVKTVKSHPQTLLITVDKNNRNFLSEEIVAHLVSAVSG